MPVITSKLLGTSITALQKQAEEEKKKGYHGHQFVMLTISNYGGNAQCTRFFFGELHIDYVRSKKREAGEAGNKRKEGDDRKQRYIRSI